MSMNEKQEDVKFYKREKWIQVNKNIKANEENDDEAIKAGISQMQIKLHIKYASTGGEMLSWGLFFLLKKLLILYSAYFF